MDEAIVCYGDFLLLYGEEFHGFLSSLGFTEPGCLVQELRFDDIHFAPNVRTMVFEIVPKLSYDSNKELKRVQAASPLARQLRSGTNIAHATSLADKEEADKLVNLSQRVQAEDEVNERTVIARRGEPVLYGQEVQLRHVLSQYFLRKRVENAEHDKSCLKVELSDLGGSAAYFRVESRFKFKQDGDRVIFGDFIQLLNTKSSFYLHISDKLLEPLLNSAPVNNRLGRSLDFLPHISAFTKAFEANLSSLKSVWQPHIFAKAPFSPEHIPSGSVINLIHTERNGLMASEGVDYTKDGLSEVFILARDEENPFEVVSSTAMFVLEANTENCKGGVYGYTSEGHAQTYRLRHLTSNRLAFVCNNQNGATLSLAKHYHEMDSGMKEKVALASLFTFTPTTGITENVVKNEVVVKISNFEDGQFLSTSAEEWSQRKPTNEKLTDAQTDLDSQFFVPIESEELSTSRFKVTLSSTNVDEDAYHLNLISSEEVMEVDFLRSSQAFLYLYGNFLRDRCEPDRSQHMKMIDVLSKLIFFTVDCDSINAYVCEGNARVRRQQYLRELGIIDLLARVLTYAFDTGVYQLSEVTQDDYIVKICTLCYRLMKHASADYRTNEMYCAQWIGLYLNHAQRTQLRNSIKAEETLTAILSDNKRLLEHFVTPKMISKFVELVRTREREAKYMKLLTVLCTSLGDAITSNQNAISEIVLNDAANCAAVLMRVRVNCGVLEVEVTEYEQWMRMDQFEDMSEKRDGKRMYRYFVALLEMVAELAYGRNHHTE